MADPTGESKSAALRLDFDRRLILRFRGSVITSDGGLLAYRELDDAVGLTDTGADTLADARTGKNGRHLLGGLLRQSVFGRLAGYEDELGCVATRRCVGWSATERLRGPPPLPARWAASRPNGWLDRRTLLPLPIFPADGSTRCTRGDRRASSCSTWIRARARLTAARRAVPTTAIS